MKILKISKNHIDFFYISYIIIHVDKTEDFRGGGHRRMVTLYTSPSCTSCRKARAWLEEH